MKTQISRDSHRPELRYSGVYQQQGRMITDADWNELMELVKRRLDDTLTDVVASGAPRKRGVKVEKFGPDLRITRGHVYADGLVARVVGADAAAETFRYDQQADFPSPHALPEKNYRVYADVWERAVNSLEDPDLRDPALHGADTTTRSQTMAQVKWCPSAVDPEDPAQNPRQGNAPLTLTLRKKKEKRDPCDPCADEVGVAARTGNYLFRLEVDDVQGSFSAPDRLTLKWSSENGAERHAVATPPAEMAPDFTTGDWVYEFYSPTSEKHLGVHLAPGFSPTRGRLEKSWPTPLPSLPEVGRWDGFCTLKRAGNIWSLVEGRDRGVKLSEVSAADADGHVDLRDDFAVKLEALILSLALRGRTFVAGDYWLAPVREAIHAAGATLLTAVPPLGITHHYLRLAGVDEAGNLAACPTAELRRLNFPPLTDLEAGDVGYVPSCPSGLFDATHDTVEKALNQVCQIAAQHIAYQAACPSGLFDATHDTVKKALDRVCQIAAGHVAFDKPCDTSIYRGVPAANLKTVADTLRLLCDIQAAHVSYKAPQACTDLAGAATVKDALDKLCLRPSGCKVIVPSGEFITLPFAIKKLLELGRRHLCLCLLPGDHKVPEGLSVEKDIHLSIVGCGPSTRLLLESQPISFTNLASITLSDLVVDSGSSVGLAIVGCREVRLTRLELVGLATTEAPLLRIAKAERIHLAGNLFEARIEDSLKQPRDILGPDMEALFADFDRVRFSREVVKASAALAALTPGKREGLAAEVKKRAERAQLTGPEVRAYGEFSATVMAQTVDAAHLVEVLRAIRARTVAAQQPVAVSIADAAADTTIEDCEIVGRLQLYGSKPGGDLSEKELAVIVGLLKNLKIETSGPALQLRGNRLTSLTVADEMLQRLRDSKGGVLGRVFGTAHLSDNIFTSPGNQLVSGFLNLTANVFHVNEPVGWALDRSAVCVGNQAEEKAKLINFSPVPSKLGANTLEIDLVQP